MVLSMPIRKAEARDAEAVAGLLGELGYPTTRAAAAERLAALDGRDPVFVLDEDGATIGVIALHIGPELHRDRPVTHIVALVVTDAMRGRDKGLVLVQHAIAVARDRGCGLIELTSRLERESAHGFYEAAGFTRTAHRFSRDL